MQALRASSYPPLPERVEQCGEIDRILSEPEVRTLLGELTLYTEELRLCESFDPVVYRRNRLFRSEFLDLLLLCWGSGQRTPLHDHAGSICGVSVIRGRGTEVAFTPAVGGTLVPSGIRELTAGDITVSHDTDVHLIGNPTLGEFVTLHCYSPPLAGMRIYSADEAFLAGYDSLVLQTGASGSHNVRWE